MWRRIERMSMEHTLGMLALRLDDARCNADELEAMIESIGVASSISTKNFILKSGRSGPFPDEVGARQRGLQARCERQTLARCVFGKTNIGQVRPRFIDVLAQCGFLRWAQDRLQRHRIHARDNALPSSRR